MIDVFLLSCFFLVSEMDTSTNLPGMGLEYGLPDHLKTKKVVETGMPKRKLVNHNSLVNGNLICSLVVKVLASLVSGRGFNCHLATRFVALVTLDMSRRDNPSLIA